VHYVFGQVIGGVISNVMHEGECFVGSKDTVQGVSRAHTSNPTLCVCVFGYIFIFYNITPCNAQCNMFLDKSS
jgi:hypothetical protein